MILGLRKSSGVQFSQTKNIPSITAPMDREDGIGKIPGDSRVAMKSWKCALIVRRSPETKTRSSSAAMRRTSGSRVPSGIVPAASRKSIGGSLSEQAFPNVRIDIGVGLKTDFQASLVGASFFARSKRSIMS